MYKSKLKLELKWWRFIWAYAINEKGLKGTYVIVIWSYKYLPKLIMRHLVSAATIQLLGKLVKKFKL